jgi:hypothetical protein
MSLRDKTFIFGKTSFPSYSLLFLSKISDPASTLSCFPSALGADISKHMFRQSFVFWLLTVAAKGMHVFER